MINRVRGLNLLKLQRKVNIMSFREVFYLVIIALLCLTLLSREEHIILEDPVSKSRIWFKGDLVSKVYLEDMSLHFAHLMLDKNVQNAKYNHEKILSYVAPENYTVVKAKLLEDFKRYKKENLSTSFYPSKINLNLKNNTVVMSGKLLTRVANRLVTEESKKFKVRFNNKHVTWYLAEFKAAEGEDNV